MRGDPDATEALKELGVDAVKTSKLKSKSGKKVSRPAPKVESEPPKETVEQNAAGIDGTTPLTQAEVNLDVPPNPIVGDAAVSEPPTGLAAQTFAAPPAASEDLVSIPTPGTFGVVSEDPQPTEIPAASPLAQADVAESISESGSTSGT